MHAEHAHLIAPRAKPDGTVEWEEQRPEIADLLRNGDPATGWLGDDRLSLHLNVAFKDDEDEQAKVPAHKRGLPRWEVWRNHEGTDPTFVGSCIAQRIDGHQLTAQLAAHDSRTHDVYAEIKARNEAEKVRRDREFGDYAEDRADKLAFALGKDLSIPAQSGRLIPLGGRP